MEMVSYMLEKNNFSAQSWSHRHFAMRLHQLLREQIMYSALLQAQKIKSRFYNFVMANLYLTQSEWSQIEYDHTSSARDQNTMTTAILLLYCTPQ